MCKESLESIQIFRVDHTLWKALCFKFNLKDNYFINGTVSGNLKASLEATANDCSTQLN
jgi:hypothetical protein